MAAEMPSGCEIVAGPRKATSRYPACAMEEYASMRFTLFCTSAPMLPKVIESAAEIHTSQNHGGSAEWKTFAETAANKMRSRTAKAAALGPVDMRPTMGAG